jgi:uncharacterized protein
VNEPATMQRYLAATSYLVLGASTDREKYGNKVLRCLQQHGKTVFPVNPKASQVEGAAAFPSIAAIPQRVSAASIITPPAVTEAAIPELVKHGVEVVWMQPGAESARAIQAAEAAGLAVIAGGPCVLVVMGYRDH